MSIFSFKQFTIKQLKSAAKVGTDGVLLGAWTPIEKNPKQILDIGAGTGLIGLMLAQRSGDAHVTAIEIDALAFEECQENFNLSPWSDRLSCLHGDIKNLNLNNKFDLIVSNPPFYTETTFAPNVQRNAARNTISLDFGILIEKSVQHLNSKGILALIVPYKEENLILDLAKDHQLHPSKLTRVKGHSNAEVKRSLMAFSREKESFEVTSLVIEETRHQYTTEYRNLTKDFYIKL